MCIGAVIRGPRLWFARLIAFGDKGTMGGNTSSIFVRPRGLKYVRAPYIDMAACWFLFVV